MTGAAWITNAAPPRPRARPLRIIIVAGRVHRLAADEVVDVRAQAADAGFSVTRSEMRRFLCRPPSVELSATGFSWP